MEVFNPNNMKVTTYRSLINQNGSGAEMDRYIYSNQEGEGIASFLGNIARTVIPFLGKAIKGAATIAKPHLKQAGADIVRAGTKRVLKGISGDIDHKKHSKKRQKKWPNL